MLLRDHINHVDLLMLRSAILCLLAGWYRDLSIAGRMIRGRTEAEHTLDFHNASSIVITATVALL